MRISHEAIYQALYVESRGALTRELVACLRTGRALRVPRARTRQKAWAHVAPEVLITERPDDAEDRAIPGHWEGDLIIGLQRSAIGTLVERTSRFTMLVHLPREEGWGVIPRTKNGPALAGYGAVTMADALARTITGLPDHVCRSLTWDRGKEMSAHARLTAQTGLPVYFADPHSPWQRGTNENTNGLLRQYFPKGTDLSRWSAEDIAAVAATLNSRPRKTLGWNTPPKSSPTIYDQPQAPVLRPPIESAQYTSSQYARAATDTGVRLSVGSKGQCWDNAVAESFFATIKTELLDRQAWANQSQGAQGNLRVHRGLVQHLPQAFQPRLPQPRRLRRRRLTPGSLTTYRPCPSKRDKPRRSGHRGTAIRGGRHDRVHRTGKPCRARIAGIGARGRRGACGGIRSRGEGSGRPGGIRGTQAAAARAARHGADDPGTDRWRRAGSGLRGDPVPLRAGRGLPAKPADGIAGRRTHGPHRGAGAGVA